MNFQALLHALHADPARVVLPASWANGRASFGGLVAALVFEVMRLQVPDGRPLRSLAITFVAPLAPDVPASYEAEVLREGGSVSQVLGKATQNGQVCALVQGSFGAPRNSKIHLRGERAPVIKAVEDCPQLSYMKGLTPELVQHLAMRWAVGGMPFSNNPSREMGGWVRLRDGSADEVVSEAHLLVLVDAWPPAVLAHLSNFAAGSSLTWTIEFMQPAPVLHGLDWCQYRALIEHAQGGYSHVAASLWAPSGELVAISRQTVVVFG
jgi:acyl-CoA thioesterase